MIAVDTNLLVYGHRRDSDFHHDATACIRRLAEAREPWAIPWPSVHEFVAIVTHPRIFDPPTKLKAAIDQVNAWLESPSLALLAEGPDYWRVMSQVLSGSRAAGPVVHDARIAALCRFHGVNELWTVDRDFSRFPGLTAVNPLAG